ncbi:DMT family transporter [Texcoconibacillus texcoconensis]|uniref:Drug/metabolite transporter (DMT)-like permease n=1 Tax=Texcoconibacillus texcoconensis TaxID=1095777 RepID=A0A840QLS6_9BACI|nr:EamA family transporter [Texcoconibacillus texcoconensis]MBB5172318.1 drug/metabolite transporter (DMT)-like permease [Texcoconibacillus texcoconensis]
MRLAYFSTILGAALWGLIGIFVQGLYSYGFTPWEVVGIRLFVSAVLTVLFLLIFSRRLLVIQLKHIPFFIGTGIISISFFNWAYFTVMEGASLSLAVTLLYTGPVFVTILSRLIFQEALTTKKLSALVMTVVGCSFVVGFLPFGTSSISMSLLITGVASGFFYALYSIFGKFVSPYYNPLTITAYSMIFGALFLLPTSQLWEKQAVFAKPEVWLLAIGLAIIATVLGYIFYTYGLARIESSRASILSTIEPVVAISVGVLIFGDSMEVWQVLGMILVITSVFLTIETKKEAKVVNEKSTQTSTG